MNILTRDEGGKGLLIYLVKYRAFNNSGGAFIGSTRVKNRLNGKMSRIWMILAVSVGCGF